MLVVSIFSSTEHQQMWVISLYLIHTVSANATVAKSLQSCLTLCDPIDGRPPGSSVPGILQARTLEWVAIAFCNSWAWKVKVKSLSHVRLFVTPWTAAFQAPPSMGFSRQEYWSGVPLPSPAEVPSRAWIQGGSESQLPARCWAGALHLQARPVPWGSMRKACSQPKSLRELRLPEIISWNKVIHSFYVEP